MPLSESDLKYLWDMVGFAKTATALISGMTREAYLADQRTQLAVERCVEVIGEAARNVSAVGQAALPAVEWRPIVATRHIIAHDYGEIDQSTLWRIVTVHVPKLLVQLAPVLEANDPGPESTKNPAEP